MILRTLQKMENEKIRFPTENDGEHDATRPTRDPHTRYTNTSFT